MNGALLFGIIAIYLLICVAIGLLRGFLGSCFRTVTTILSAVIAIVATLILRQNILGDTFVADTLIPFLETNQMQEVIDLLNISPTLCEALLGCASALFAPLLCLVIFLLVSLLTWIVYLILSIVLRKLAKTVNKKVKISLLYAGLAAFVQGVIVVIIVMIPVTCYTGIIADAGEDIIASGLVAEDPEMEEMLKTSVETSKELEGSAAVKFFGGMGAKGLGNSMTSFEVKGEKTMLRNEFGAIASLLGNVTSLTSTDIAQYGEKEAQRFDAIADSFKHSVMLPSVAGELIYNATDAWMNGEKFIGVEKPMMGENELFNPLLDELLLILHTDSTSLSALQADIYTVADLISIFATNGVFANMNDTEQLMTVLSGEGVVDSLVTTLGANNSMKRLIPQITNLGIRAIGQALSIPENVQEVYGEFLDEVAVALNEVKGQSGAAQVQALSAKLDTAFDEAGVNVDSEILDFYSSTLVHDLIDNNSNETITSNDVQAFFALYAAYAVPKMDDADAGDPTQTLSATGSVLDVLLIGTPYEGMSEEDLQNSAVAKFADLCKKLSQIPQDENFAQAAAQVVTETFTELLGEESEVLAHIQTVELTKPVSADSINNTASLQSPEQMNTSIVTLDAILIDTTTAADNINDETLAGEAGAISSIFNAATNLVGTDTENMDLNTVAGSVGNILDSLSQSSTYGSDKTSDLFAAVFQSETVRNSAGLDMKTATEMANKATEGDVNYTDTLTSVSNSIDVLSKLENSDGTLNEEELAEVIRGITPQTAGMLEVYVTPARLIGFGTPEQYADTSAALIVSMFSYMGREDLEDYDAEARALNQVLNVAMAAKDGENNQPLFSTAPGANDGRLPTETETMDTLMASHALTYAIKDVMTDGTKVTVMDPFGVSAQVGGGDSQTAQNIIAAVNDYIETHPDADRLALEGIAAMFGVAVDF